MKSTIKNIKKENKDRMETTIIWSTKERKRPLIHWPEGHFGHKGSHQPPTFFRASPDGRAQVTPISQSTPCFSTQLVSMHARQTDGRIARGPGIIQPQRETGWNRQTKKHAYRDKLRQWHRDYKTDTNTDGQMDGNVRKIGVPQA